MNNDEFAMDDLDDEKTIAFIRERLPQDLKEKYSDDEFYFFLDTIYDYYEKSGILDGNNEYVDIDINEIAEFIAAHSIDPIADLHELWGRMAFSTIIGNTDDHLRNHGFLLTSEWNKTVSNFICLM